MVESGKPKSTSSAHKISVSTDASTTKNASKNITFDEVLDDLKSLDDLEDTSNSAKSGRGRQNEPSDSEAPVALTVAPPIGAKPGQHSEAEKTADTPNPSARRSSEKRNTSATRPRPVRTTDGMVSGTVRRNNLAPITKRPLGVPLEQRRAAQQTVSAPKFKVADEDEDETPFNPLLTAFWTKKRLAIGGAILVVLALVGGTIFFMMNKSDKQDDSAMTDDGEDTDDVADANTVDYNQAIMGADGNTLVAKHQLGSEDDLAVMFSDLTCAGATCANVSNAKIGSNSLIKDTDYTATSKDGKLLLTLKASKLNTLKAGAYALIFEITNGDDGDKTSRIGFRFKIESSEQDDTQDEEEKPSGSQSSGSSSTKRPSTSGGNHSSGSTGSNNTGNSNNSGNTGNSGDSGNTGNSGNTGSSGNTGDSGNTGSTGGDTGGNTGGSNPGGDNTGPTTPGTPGGNTGNEGGNTEGGGQTTPDETGSQGG